MGGDVDYIHLGLEKGQATGCCGCGNEPSGSTTCGKFDFLKKCQLLSDADTWSYLLREVAD
jgi:hypothetical protein